MKLANTLRTLVAACALVVTAHASAAPVLLVDSNGILTGANGVDVGGTMYNVRFADGSCNSLFNGCSTSSFTFLNETSSLAAARALLDQVLVDGLLGNFDSNPGLVRGCTSNPYCFTIIPYGDFLSTSFGDVVFGANVINVTPAYTFIPGDQVQVSGSPPDFDTSGFSTNYAIFSAASVDEGTVPEPASIALFGLAMAGLAFNRHRKA